MFYKLPVQDHIRVPPEQFEKDLTEAIFGQIRRKYDGFISKTVGVVLDVVSVDSVGEGVIIPGDGAAYYNATFSVLVFRPEVQETLYGVVKDIADFGAFMTIGPIDGMIHISQTMNDYVSFSKDKVLQGKDTNRSLKVADTCKARVIAVSYKDVTNPKIGLTMRQNGLGKLEWVAEDLAPAEPKAAE